MKHIEAIVYLSQAGHTKAFAGLLSERTGLPAYELEAAVKQLKKGTPVIFLGWMMAGQVRGIRKAVKQFDVKAVCGVGMATAGSLVQMIRKANPVPAEAEVFSLQGGFEMDKIDGVYKKMMQVMIKTVGGQLQKKKERSASDEEMLYLLTHDENRVSPEQLEEILNWYREGGTL